MKTGYGLSLIYSREIVNSCNALMHDTIILDVLCPCDSKTCVQVDVTIPLQSITSLPATRNPET
jgi:hypothetical protein